MLKTVVAAHCYLISNLNSRVSPLFTLHSSLYTHCGCHQPRPGLDQTDRDKNPPPYLIGSQTSTFFFNPYAQQADRQVGRKAGRPTVELNSAQPSLANAILVEKVAQLIIAARAATQILLLGTVENALVVATINGADDTDGRADDINAAENLARSRGGEREDLSLSVSHLFMFMLMSSC